MEMKLLKIENKSENSLDAVLMIVPNDYDKKKALDKAIDLDSPTITEEIDIGDFRESDFYLYHPYFG